MIAAPDTASLRYQSGFGSELSSEALPGALPIGRNSPQRAPYGLYVEQLSGTAFTAPRHANRRAWLYRIRPAVMHGVFSEFAQPSLASGPFDEVATSPNQMRWDPFPVPERPTDFIEGLTTVAGNGSAAAQYGIAIHVYACNRSMRDRFFYDADGEMLVVPQQGALRIATEFGALAVEPGEIALLPRRAATSAKTTARCCGCRSSARSVRTASQIRGISRYRSPTTATARVRSSWSQR